MKFAYRVINNKNRRVESDEEVKTIAPSVGTHNGIVSFILVSKNTIGFRESAQIVKIAEETGCRIEIASGKKSGASDSILSLVNLGIVKDKSLVLTIKGDNNADAFHKVSEVISEEPVS